MWTEKHSYTTYDCVDNFSMQMQTSIHCQYCGILFLLHCVMVFMFLYAYYVMLYRRCSQLQFLAYFKVLMLNVTICNVLLHLSNFCLCLSSIADFSNTGVRAPTSAESALFSCAKNNLVWTCGLSESHGNFSMAIF